MKLPVNSSARCADVLDEPGPYAFSLKTASHVIATNVNQFDRSNETGFKTSSRQKAKLKNIYGKRLFFKQISPFKLRHLPMYYAVSKFKVQRQIVVHRRSLLGEGINVFG